MIDYNERARKIANWFISATDTKFEAASKDIATELKALINEVINVQYDTDCATHRRLAKLEAYEDVAKIAEKYYGFTLNPVRLGETIAKAIRAQARELK